MKIKECPQWIIQRGEDGKFHIDNDLLDELKSIDSNLVPIAITGKYRTGKSYLLNRIAGVKYGFDVAASLEPKTKGIWVWLRDHPKNNRVKLLLFDTEGLGDPSKSTSDHDNWIYILAILLSSIVIHNTMGNVGRDIISDLSCMTELSRRLVHGDSGPRTVHQPLFILALRDFTLSLEMEGVKVTPDEYFESLLRTKSADEPALQCPRKSIINFFPVRKCFVFETPGKRKQLANLQNLADENLDEDFVEELHVFLEYIYKICRPGQEHFHPVNGPIVAGLITSYVSGINSGAVPSIETTFLSLIKGENEKLKNVCVDTYYNSLREEVGIPIEDIGKFEEVHRIKFDEGIEKFTSGSFGNDKYKESFLTSLKVAMEKRHQEILEESERESIKNCGLWLDPKSRELIENLVTGQYDNSDGMSKFESHLKAIEDDYNGAPGLGYNRGDMWAAFKKDWKTTGLKVEWRNVIKCAFLPWRKCREESIMSLIRIIEQIQGQVREFHIGNFKYSSAGIFSTVLTLSSLAVAAPIAGAGLGLAGIALGVASGVAGGHAALKKETNIQKLEKKAKDLLKKDKAEFEKLKSNISELNHLIHRVACRIGGDGSTLDMAVGIGRAGGSIGRLTFDIVDIAEDFARIGARGMTPFTVIAAAVDAVNIVYSAWKLNDDKLCEKANLLVEPLIQLGEGLQETNKWFKDVVPSDLQGLIPL